MRRRWGGTALLNCDIADRIKKLREADSMTENEAAGRYDEKERVRDCQTRLFVSY